MKLALLFPQFAPNLYDLASMMKADRVVLQDTERWSRKSRTHRAQIRIVEGTQWVNLPVRTEDKKKSNAEVRIDHSEAWLEPFWNALEYNYRNSIYFDFYEAEIRNDLNMAFEFDTLLEFNLYFLSRMFRYLELGISCELSSQLDNYNEDPDKFAAAAGADILFQEYEARNYQRQANGNILKTALDEHPVYKQHFEGFESECCVLDLIFQYGPESFRVLDQL
ncbi:WbqC family protein [Balneola sp. MJW-20]|uniref:WbqC family protein n=1 Tax=Gracilimonas aurantiaca TaxID=3234185 RepID=UPI003467C2C7